MERSIKACWVCDQKQEWLVTKLNAARDKAKLLLDEKKETIVIYKEGPNYNFTTEREYAGTAEPIEYLS